MRIKRGAENVEVGPHLRDQLRIGDHRPAHDVPMAGSEFRQAVQKHVDVELAVLMRPGEGVVQDRQRAMTARQLA